MRLAARPTYCRYCPFTGLWHIVNSIPKPDGRPDSKYLAVMTPHMRPMHAILFCLLPFFLFRSRDLGMYVQKDFPDMYLWYLVRKS